MTLPADNPFATRSTEPFEMPPFASIHDEHYEPALLAGMAEELAEAEAIASNPAPPTFENTIVALERTGRLLERVTTVLFSLTSSDATPFLDDLEAKYAPKLTAHSDAILLDSRLYERVQAVVDQLPELGLTPEQERLATETLTELTLAGAGLADDEKERLSTLNQRLSELTTKFEQQLLADTNELALIVDSRDELDGLDDAEIQAAAAAATERGREGAYAITLVLPTGHPYLASLTRRDVRERVFAASKARGSRGNAHDTRNLVLEIARLRAERAELLGFPSHAALKAARSTAGSPDAITARLKLLVPPAICNASREQAALQALADAQQDAKGEPRFALEPWDWSFYAEQLRHRDYDIDVSKLRPYFEADRVLHDGVFGAASLVYGISFRERDDVTAQHPEARVFDVLDTDGTALGLYVLDLYTRDSKRGGAWMTSYVQQNALFDDPTVVINQLNVPKPPAGTPTLLTLDEVETLFHEFGHALHGLMAKVTYPRFGGTSVYRDFVEYPSQVNEMWMFHPAILERYARHYETGEPLDVAVVERLTKASTFNEGFMTSEYLAATVIDQAWHRLSAAEARAVTDVEAFEREALAAWGLDNPVVPSRYSSPYFQHVFGGGYSAGYYGYIWSEVFDAATVEVFDESADVRGTGERFRRIILEPGGSRDANELVHEFFGGEPSIEPLLRRRGLDD